jgi:hypothetical protein
MTSRMKKHSGNSMGIIKPKKNVHSTTLRINEY